MYRTKNLRALVALAFVLLLSFSTVGLAQGRKGKDKKKKAPTGKPVIWKDPGNIAARNLFLGPGGEEMRPDTTSLTFIKAETGGYSPKFRVRDAGGREWVAKLGKEAQSETAAVRLLWAIGYLTEVNYLVPCVHIQGAPRPRKKVERCEGQGFANVRFEARPEGVERAGQWKWKRNPFVGTKELQGLVVMMGFLNNWDIKDSNNVILYVPNRGIGESRYAISDLGATFGKTGRLPFFWRITRSRNNPKDYANASFIDKVKGNRVAFRYQGKNSGLFRNIALEDARWLAGLLSRLSDQQIEDAFRAANYSPAEVRMMTDAVRRRITELVNLPEPGLAFLSR
ncbi:MAG TPA: hypothetical protein VJS44_00425 [Pyrinomonadaceae bacterium]|nr:hypothetical protein [Pyrinomonadaceae bacterium]